VEPSNIFILLLSEALDFVSISKTSELNVGSCETCNFKYKTSSLKSILLTTIVFELIKFESFTKSLVFDGIVGLSVKSFHEETPLCD